MWASAGRCVRSAATTAAMSWYATGAICDDDAPANAGLLPFHQRAARVAISVLTRIRAA